MLFAVCLGDEGAIPVWREAVQAHVGWLGLSVRQAKRRVGGGRTFAFAFLRSASAIAGPEDISSYPHPYLLLSAHAGLVQPDPEMEDEAALRRWLTDDKSPAAIRMGVSLHTGEILAAAPPAHVERLYWGQIPGGQVLGTDLRLMARLCGRELDERGVYGLFHYRLNPTPYTLFKGIRCVPGGNLLRISPAPGEGTLETFFTPLAEPMERNGADPETLFTQTLDGVLSRVEGPIIGFFSGGVDSSLLAARMAALGRTDATLVNSSFGWQDRAANTARRIAAHLGLRLEQVLWNPADIPAALQRLGRDYTTPFCDPATVAGNLLAHAALSAVHSAQMATTGAGVGPVWGQGLRLYAQWEQASRIPRWARWAAGGFYASLGLWRHPTQVERAVGVLRRAGRVSLLQAGLVTNPLDGIAYHASYTTRREVETKMAVQLEQLTRGGQTFWEKFCLVRALSNPGHDFPAIVFDPLAVSGVRVVNPYLEPPMMHLGFSLTKDEKCPGGELKGLMKRVLSRHLPPELVYGTSGSYVPPHRDVFAHPAMRCLLEEVVFAPSNPLMAFARETVLREIAERVRDQRPLAATARSFLWLFVFASAWLKQTHCTREVGSV